MTDLLLLRVWRGRIKKLNWPHVVPQVVVCPLPGLTEDKKISWGTCLFTFSHPTSWETCEVGLPKVQNQMLYDDAPLWCYWCIC